MSRHLQMSSVTLHILKDSNNYDILGLSSKLLANLFFTLSYKCK